MNRKQSFRLLGDILFIQADAALAAIILNSNRRCAGHQRTKGIRRRLLSWAGVVGLALAGVSCGTGYSLISRFESLEAGREARSSVVFKLNHRPIKLELYMRVDEGSAVVELDHPDGRTIEYLKIDGPGIRELRKELPKEPGSWGLRVTASGGNVSYWAALHDRSGYIGPDDQARRLVERK